MGEKLNFNVPHVRYSPKPDVALHILRKSSIAIKLNRIRFYPKIGMKKITRLSLLILTSIVCMIVTTAFLISDPGPDYFKQNVSLFDQISITGIKTENSAIGNFKAAVKFKQNVDESSSKEFYGQEIWITNNSNVDKIRIGITNNLISRLEIWNRNVLIETKELGFMKKMTWGEEQTMEMDFHDQTNSKYKGKSKISMRFYNSTGFFGDIGTITFDLTGYGDLSGNKFISLFAKSLDSESLNNPVFSDFSIWKNFKSAD